MSRSSIFPRFNVDVPMPAGTKQPPKEPTDVEVQPHRPETRRANMIDRDDVAVKKAERALAKALAALGLPNALDDDWTAEAQAVIRAWCEEVDGWGDNDTRAAAVERAASAEPQPQ